MAAWYFKKEQEKKKLERRKKMAERAKVKKSRIEEDPDNNLRDSMLSNDSTNNRE